MNTIAITRELARDGTVVLRAGGAAFHYRALRPGALEIRIEGVDDGQFGTATLDEISVALLRERPLELFVDASAASMPAVAVSQEWTRFFALNQNDLKRVSVLVSSRSVELTVAIAQHLSQTGKLIQIYTDPDVYSARKRGI